MFGYGNHISFIFGLKTSHVREMSKGRFNVSFLSLKDKYRISSFERHPPINAAFGREEVK